MRLISILLLLTLSASQALAQTDNDVQEIKYVTDVLRLSLYKNADDKSGSLKLLTSGDELQILQRKGAYSLVRIENGTEGWVKSGFLVSEPTATNRLRDEQKKNEILAAQIEQYADTQGLIDDYEKTIGLMQQDQTTLETERDDLRQQLEALQQEHEEVQLALDKAHRNELSVQQLLLQLADYWYIIVMALLLLWLTGYWIGRRLIERQVRNRFQGVKVW